LSDKKKETQPARELPFGDVGMEKQIQMLTTFAALREKNEKSTYKDVAPIVDLHPTKVSSCIQFWKSISLLEVQGRGYRASDALLQFAKKKEWGAEDEAWSIIRSHLKESWFVEHLALALRIKKSLTEDELVNSLGSASGVTGRDAKVIKSLRILVDLLVLSKIVIKNQDGSYAFSPELTGEKAESIEVPQDGDSVKVSIGSEVYVVGREELKEFVRTHGRKLAAKDIRLE
jgi:hypothetical protein